MDERNVHSKGLIGRSQVVNIKVVDASFLLCAKASKNVKELVRHSQRILANTRYLEVPVMDSTPNSRYKIVLVKVVKVTHFVPTTKYVHAVTVHSSTESTSRSWNITSELGSDILPSFIL